MMEKIKLDDITKAEVALGIRIVCHYCGNDYPYHLYEDMTKKMKKDIMCFDCWVNDKNNTNVTG